MENSAEKVVRMQRDESLDSPETESSGLAASSSSSSLFASTSEECPSTSMNTNLQGGAMPWPNLLGGAMPWAGLQGGAMPWAGLQGGAMPWAGLQGGAMPWAGLQGGALPWAGLQGGAMSWPGLQGGVASCAGYVPPPVGYFPYFHDWRTAQELYLRNYASDSSYIIGCSSNAGHMNVKDSNACPLAENGPKTGMGDGDHVSKDKDLTKFCSRDDLRSAPSSSRVAQHTSNKKNLVDSSKTSTYQTRGCSNVIQRNTEPPESSRSKILSASGFSNYFSRQSQMAMRESARPGASAASGPVNTDRNKSKQGSASEVDARNSENRNCLRTTLPSDEVVKGINLREWLDSKHSDISKVNKLRMFRQIVQTVDMAHDHGSALAELRPSSFTLLSTGGLKYVGPLMDIKSLSIMNQEDANKRVLEIEEFAHGRKKQKLHDETLNMPQTQFTSRYSMASDTAQLEKDWYSCPDGLNFKDPLPSNVYCLGLLLFEFLCRFESREEHSAAMLDLRRLILPPSFLSENPEEAGFCFWLMHPKPSSRPTTSEILQSELLHGTEDMSLINDATSFADNVDDVESDVLLDFLVSMKEQKEDKASKLLEIINYLDADIKEVERSSSLKISATMDRDGEARQEPNLFDHQSAETSCNPLSSDTVLRDKLFKNITQLEDAYLSMRSQVQLTGTSDMDRADKDLLRNRERFSWVQTPKSLPTTEESVDRVGSFFDGICKFARYSKFEVCGTLRNSNILNSNNVISSLCFDREEEYIATAGVSRKIKIFEFSSLLDDSVDVQYPVLEMSNSSKFSCICWNRYIKNYLASADYDGLVQMWDVSTGQVLIQHKEHQKRAWAVDFSQVDPMKFASGSDDCSMKTWSINERNSTCTIWNPANVCCVQFSAFSSHLLAFGSADYKIYCYDLRHTKIPWCTLAGHGKAVSFVKFLDPETLISSSTDNTLKLWDLKKTSLEGLSSNACSLTYRGHTNDKHFVGMAALDGYIASGSETNEVYAYYRSLPMPITSHKFECIDPISGHEASGGDEQFVSSLCWRKKSEMIVAANSGGNIEILRMV